MKHQLIHDGTHSGKDSGLSNFKPPKNMARAKLPRINHIDGALIRIRVAQHGVANAYMGFANI